MKSNSKKKPRQDGETPINHLPLHQDEGARALNSLADILSRREHSIDELRNKLSKLHSTASIEYAMTQALAKHWIRPSEQIAEDATEIYARKLKSHAYIRQQMEKRGLPGPDLDFSKEQDKINQLIQRYFSKADLSDGKQRMKVLRFLHNRGFDGQSIESVIKNVDSDFEVNFEKS